MPELEKQLHELGRNLIYLSIYLYISKEKCASSEPVIKMPVLSFVKCNLEHRVENETIFNFLLCIIDPQFYLFISFPMRMKMRTERDANSLKVIGMYIFFEIYKF